MDSTVEKGEAALEYVDCALCGSGDFELLFLARDKMLYRDGRKYPAVRCKDCGLVFINPRPSVDQKSGLYGNDYPFAAEKPENAQSLFHYQPVIDYLRGCKPGRLLDVGTGNSPFLSTMKDLGWDVAGTEVDAGLVEHFRDNLSIELFHGELEDANYAAGSFDAVTIMGVIEHVPNPRILLEEAARVLKEDGVLAMWCFNRSIEAKLLGKYWLGFDAPRHLYSFSYETMNRLLSDTGFQLTDSLFRPVCYLTYSAVWAASRIRNRFRSRENRTPTFRLGLPRFLEVASRPIAKGLASRQLSSNMYLFARKAVKS